MVLFRVAEAMLGCVMQPTLCQHDLLMSNAGQTFDCKWQQETCMTNLGGSFLSYIVYECLPNLPDCLDTGQALSIAQFMLQRKAAGGMYDQAGGNFLNYIVDRNMSK